MGDISKSGSQIVDFFCKMPEFNPHAVRDLRILTLKKKNNFSDLSTGKFGVQGVLNHGLML